MIRLWIEFLALFVVAPLALAIVLPPSALFPALFAVTGVGVVLLHFTKGFQWRFLWSGFRDISWRFVLLFSVATFALCLAVVYLTAPEAAFAILRFRPEVLIMIALLYPLVSALPQEIVFRPLFFRRYKAILPGGQAAIILNGALFSLAHLMYWSWIVAGMTFVGGLVFAWAYKEKQSFPLAVILHGIAGNLLFLAGLGIYFYSGNVVRPF